MAREKKRTPRLARHLRPPVVLSVGHSHELIRGIISEARARDWPLLDLTLTRSAMPTDPGPMGAIVECFASHPLSRRLREMGCPTVRISNLADMSSNAVPSVILDLVAAGRMAADHFAERGFRHYGYIGNAPMANSGLLYEGFSERVAALGHVFHLLQLKSEHIPETDEARAGKYRRKVQRIGEWVLSLPKPIALLGYHDHQAALICMACREVGLMVPEDVAILGMNNSLAICELSPVELSSIDFNREASGRQAVRLLDRLIKGEPRPTGPIMLPPKGVVERHSTDMLAVSDPRVARAIRFIWDHLDWPLSGEDIAREINVSRSTLDRAFQQCLGRGANAELRRKRLERSCELLLDTKQTVTDIAKATGFRSKPYFHRAFLKAYGMTPNEYRNRRGSGSSPE